jgi:polyisoprenoid-binding protein YceI
MGWMLGSLLPLAALCSAASAAAEPRNFTVDPAASRILVQVGKAGLFKFAGHEHEVAAPIASGSVVADVQELGRSSVILSWNSAELRVTGKGEPAEDVPKVQGKMVGAEVLDVGRHPRISFTSRAISGRSTDPGAWELLVTGDLVLRGVSREVALPMLVTLQGDELKATGRYVLKQRDYALEPVSVAGVVKVKNELTITYSIVARARN